VPRWGIFEGSVENPRTYADPYGGVRLDVVLTKPDGGRVTVAGFHDGGATWRFRVVPDLVGGWRFSATFSDGAPGATGSFTCEASDLPGAIDKDADNRRFTCRCRACGERTTLRSPPAPYERSKVTCEWLAWLVYQKFWLLTPLDRIRRDLAERGIPLAMGTMVGFIERAADLLAGVDGLHWKQLLASPWMATDGTGLKVVVPELPAAHNGYIELYRNDDVAVFQYEADKSGDIVAKKLAPFQGTLTAAAKLYCSPEIKTKARAGKGVKFALMSRGVD
jgi:hypothetical protein